MPDQPADNLSNVKPSAMQEFCAAIGEIILWASLIDGQLNKAILCVFTLPDHPFIAPIIAQLDARQKAEVLKKRARLMPDKDWKRSISRWTEAAEKVNAKRNIVAHHSIQLEDGEIKLHTEQLSKVLAKLEFDGETVTSRDAMGIKELREWIEEAKRAHNEGEELIAELQAFRKVMLAELGEGEPK